MKITIKNSSMVKPAADTPQCTIWNSNIDLVIPRIHVPTVYFYKPVEEKARGDYFECEHLKEALRRALVSFYPMAGRLKKRENGRIDIECNGDGVLFVEASADGPMSEYGEFFAPCMKMRELIPHVDLSRENSSFSLLILQVTVFKCGGVSLGVGVHHHVADGLAALRFINYWAALARGIEEDVKPFFDRTLLRARDPPKPLFAHVEYQTPPSLLEVEEVVNHVKPNGECAKVDGGIVEVTDGYAGVNSDHAEVHCSRITANDNHVRANDYVKPNGDHVKANGDHVIGDSLKSNADSKINDGYGKANGDFSEAHEEYGKADGPLSNSKLSGESSKLHGDCFKVNGDCVPKQHPFTKKPRKAEHNPLLEQIAKISEEMTDGEDYGEGGPIAADLFVFSKEFVSSLKSRAAEHAITGERPFSSYEVLAAHVWRCACLARDLQDAQLTKLYIATDGRSRLQPPLPPDYFGNVIFTATPVECAGRLVDSPLADAARLIRKTVQIMDDEYLRSALDYLELQPNLGCFSRGAHTFRTPNLGITSWVRLPLYGADFGWGPPLSMAPAGVPFEGLAYLLPGPLGDTRLRLSITLTPWHMRRFQEHIYQF